jgi:hypothetical protein
MPGKDFDPEDIIEGLFRGYLIERVYYFASVLFDDCALLISYRFSSIYSHLLPLLSQAAFPMEHVLATQKFMGCLGSKPNTLRMPQFR